MKANKEWLDRIENMVSHRLIQNELDGTNRSDWTDEEAALIQKERAKALFNRNTISRSVKPKKVRKA